VFFFVVDLKSALDQKMLNSQKEFKTSYKAKKTCRDAYQYVRSPFPSSRSSSFASPADQDSAAYSQTFATRNGDRRARRRSRRGCSRSRLSRESSQRRSVHLSSRVSYFLSFPPLYPLPSSSLQPTFAPSRSSQVDLPISTLELPFLLSCHPIH
jgi:hypothetical protein